MCRAQLSSSYKDIGGDGGIGGLTFSLSVDFKVVESLIRDCGGGVDMDGPQGSYLRYCYVQMYLTYPPS